MRKVIGKIKNPRFETRYRRKLSIRATLFGSAARPRVCAVKTNKHLQVQVIDDLEGKTLFSVQTYGKEAVSGVRKNKEGAKVVGAKVAEKLKANGIETVVFDRNGMRYAGLVAVLADAIRENGIKV